MDTFYRAVLGPEPGESLELSDPFGLCADGVASADRAVRAVLNVAQSKSTAMSRAISTQGGSSVHHIAFATNDIFDTMAKLRRNGAQFVPISANYYEDLRARFDLPADDVARMRDFHILFERTATGEYLHAYSESFADRFFFEVVQRVGDYDGYGALNAAARLASQSQVPHAA